MKLEDETLKLIQPFLDIKNPNHRKVVKLAERLALDGSVDPAVRSLSRALLSHRKPMNYLQTAAQAAQELSKQIAHYADDPEVHGIVMHTKRVFVDVYPIRINCFPKWLVDGPWHPDQEIEILRDAGDTWGEITGIKNVIVRIALFTEYGFSGKTHLVEI